MTPAYLSQARDYRAGIKAEHVCIIAFTDFLFVVLQAWTHTGYQYNGDVYREIAMENSNFGGASLDTCSFSGLFTVLRCREIGR
tara:strand:- start:319 stop:570 length:252 start_codon:yes stop_codon:yes gene_type:complete